MKDKKEMIKELYGEFPMRMLFSLARKKDNTFTILFRKFNNTKIQIKNIIMENNMKTYK